MDRFTKLNNVGAAQVAKGLYADAVTTFTASLRIIKSYLAALASEKKGTWGCNRSCPRGCNPGVEASVAILFNLALSHHLNALYGPFHCRQELNFTQREPFQSNPVVSTLDQAIALYELAYTMQMQEDVDLSVELTMAIINNLGHIHRRMGDEHKAVKCFRQLLSTILFLQSYGNQTYQTDTFLYSISHLILRDSTAAAA